LDIGLKIREIKEIDIDARRPSEIRKVYVALGMMGFLTAVAQIVFLRKGIVNFSGNELGLVLGLFAWLIWVGGGGLLSRRLFRNILRPERALYLALLLLLILFPVTVIAIDLIRPLLGVPVGQIVGLGFMSGAYILLLAPFCIVDGADFAFGSAAAGKGKVPVTFAVESAGAAAGGVFFFAAGARWFTPLSIAWILMTVIAAVLIWISWNYRYIRLIAIIVCIVGLCLMGPVGKVIEETVSYIRWQGFTVFAEKESPLGSLVWAVKINKDSSIEQETLFYDGSPLVSYPDIRSAEEAVQPALIAHPLPARVLIISSRSSGILKQALMHPADHIDLVMMDQEVLQMERTWIPETDDLIRQDRVSVATGDGRQVIKNAPDGHWDVIILDMPDPDTLMFNRYYTLEFFRQAARVLTEDGLFSLSAGEPANYITGSQGKYIAALDRSLSRNFPHRSWYPLGRYVVLAGRSKLTALDGAHVDKVADERGLDLKYMTSGYLDYDLSAERITAVERAIEGEKAAGMNMDIVPNAVRQRLKLWRGQTGYAGILSLPESTTWWNAFSIALAVMVLAGFALAVYGSTKIKGSMVIAAGGFAGIGVEAVLLYLYQVHYGYLYSRIALLLSLYMAGLAAGSLVVMQNGSKGLLARLSLLKIRSEKRVALPLWLWTGFLLLTGFLMMTGFAGAMTEEAGLVLFVILMASAGILTGISFAAGTGVLEGAGLEHVGGLSYGLDLAGAAAGVVICGLVLPLGAGLFAPVRFLLLLMVALAAGLSVGFEAKN